MYEIIPQYAVMNKLYTHSNRNLDLGIEFSARHWCSILLLYSAYFLVAVCIATEMWQSPIADEFTIN